MLNSANSMRIDVPSAVMADRGPVASCNFTFVHWITTFHFANITLNRSLSPIFETPLMRRRMVSMAVMDAKAGSRL